MQSGLTTSSTRVPPSAGQSCGCDGALQPDWVSLNLIGEAASFRAALDDLLQCAKADATVLLAGETGTGKELAARAIHYLGARHGGPFVPVNCGAIPDALVESELFGHVRGAFTDAKTDGRGMIALAEGGTLFLDEVDSLSTRAQAAILRFVQDHCYRPVGAPRFASADVRIVAAANSDLQTRSRAGQFREDLLFRLNLLTVSLPPLRERPGDPLLLAQAFLKRLSIQYHVQRQLDAASVAALHCHHEWPGNVRELEHRVHRGFLMAHGDSVDLGLGMAATGEPPVALPGGPLVAFAQAKALVIAEFERRYVRDLLVQARGNLSLAARLAGKERSRFGKLMKKYGLERPPLPKRVPPRA